MKSILTLAVLLLLIAGVAGVWPHAQSQPSKPSPEARAENAVQITKPQHLVYPYSIVSGGIHDFESLVRAGKAGLLPFGFDMSKAVFKLLDRDIDVHVTFSKDGKIHWSSKAVHLRKGERVITDGVYTILVRCGNVISTILPGDADTEELPADGSIPTSEPTGTPEFTSTLYPAPTYTPPVGITENWPLPPTFPPVVVCCAIPVQPPLPVRPPLNVPDGDSERLLVLTSLASIGLVFLRKRFRRP